MFSNSDMTSMSMMMAASTLTMDPYANSPKDAAWRKGKLKAPTPQSTKRHANNKRARQARKKNR